MQIDPEARPALYRLAGLVFVRAFAIYALVNAAALILLGDGLRLLADPQQAAISLLGWALFAGLLGGLLLHLHLRGLARHRPLITEEALAPVQERVVWAPGGAGSVRAYLLHILRQLGATILKDNDPHLLKARLKGGLFLRITVTLRLTESPAQTVVTIRCQPWPAFLRLDQGLSLVAADELARVVRHVQRTESEE